MEKVILFLKSKPNGINLERLPKIAWSGSQTTLRKPAPLLKNGSSSAIIQKVFLVQFKNLEVLLKFLFSFSKISSVVHVIKNLFILSYYKLIL